jgi:predicted small secreted protein
LKELPRYIYRSHKEKLMKKALILISALAVALLAGCGGGGGGGGDVQKPEITNVTY